MPLFDVTSPDGKRYRVNGPEGGTQEDAIRYVQENQANIKPEVEQGIVSKATDAATDTAKRVGTSVADAGIEAIKGVGRMAADAGSAIVKSGQRLGILSDADEDKYVAQNARTPRDAERLRDEYRQSKYSGGIMPATGQGAMPVSEINRRAIPTQEVEDRSRAARVDRAMRDAPGLRERLANLPLAYKDARQSAATAAAIQAENSSIAPNLADTFEGRVARGVTQGMLPSDSLGKAINDTTAGAAERPLVGTKTDDELKRNFEDSKDYANSSIATRALKKGAEGLYQGGAGLLESYADAVGSDAGGSFANAAKKSRESVNAMGRRDGFAGQVEDAATSIVQNVPALFAGVVSGGAAMPLAMMGAQSFGQSYSEAKSRGSDGASAAIYAGVNGAAEIIGEMVGVKSFGKLLGSSLVGKPIRQVATAAADHIVHEIPGEQLTTLIQFLADKGFSAGKSPNANLADYLSQAGDTLAQTILQSGMMYGGMAAIDRISAKAGDALRGAPGSSLRERLNLLAETGKPEVTLPQTGAAPGMAGGVKPPDTAPLSAGDVLGTPEQQGSPAVADTAEPAPQAPVSDELPQSNLTKTIEKVQAETEAIAVKQQAEALKEMQPDVDKIFADAKKAGLAQGKSERQASLEAEAAAMEAEKQHRQEVKALSSRIGELEGNIDTIWAGVTQRPAIMDTIDQAKAAAEKLGGKVVKGKSAEQAQTPQTEMQQPAAQAQPAPAPTPESLHDQLADAVKTKRIPMEVYSKASSELIAGRPEEAQRVVSALNRPQPSATLDANGLPASPAPTGVPPAGESAAPALDAGAIANGSEAVPDNADAGAFSAGSFSGTVLSRGEQHAVAVAKFVADRLGVRINWLNDKGETAHDGYFNKADPDAVNINVGSDRAVIAVFGHEVLHLLKNRSPEVYAKLLARIKPMLRDVPTYRAWMAKKYKERGLNVDDATIDAHTLEEIAADLLGDYMADPSFWRDLFKDQSTSWVNQMKNVIVRMLDAISLRLRLRSSGEGFASHTWVKGGMDGLTQVRAALMDAFKEWEAEAATVNAAADAAAMSPNNDLAEPTELQKATGAYKKGHWRIAGMNIAIENPKGSKRNPKWPTLKAHYGYIKGVIGKDGDHIDVFIKDGLSTDYSGPVFVIDQQAEDGSFDEHKVMLGWTKQAAAEKAYLSNYTKGWSRIGGIRSFENTKMFREWLKAGDLTQPATTTMYSDKFRPSIEDTINAFDDSGVYDLDFTSEQINKDVSEVSTIVDMDQVEQYLAQHPEALGDVAPTTKRDKEIAAMSKEERSIYNKGLHKVRQWLWARTATKKFKKWFGESVVVGEDGLPRIYFRGDNRDLREFDTGTYGKDFNNEGHKDWVVIFTSPSAYFANNYTSNTVLASKVIPTMEKMAAQKTHKKPSINRIYPVFIRAENPWDWENAAHIEAVASRLAEMGMKSIEKDFSANAPFGSWMIIENTKVQEIIRSLGHDSFYTHEGGEKNLAVYSKNQLKSAIANSGEYSRDTNDIMLSMRDRPVPSAAKEIASFASKYVSAQNKTLEPVASVDRQAQDDKRFAEFFAQAVAADDGVTAPIPVMQNPTVLRVFKAPNQMMSMAVSIAKKIVNKHGGDFNVTSPEKLASLMRDPIMVFRGRQPDEFYLFLDAESADNKPLFVVVKADVQIGGADGSPKSTAVKTAYAMPLSGKGENVESLLNEKGRLLYVEKEKAPRAFKRVQGQFLNKVLLAARLRERNVKDWPDVVKFNADQSKAPNNQVPMLSENSRPNGVDNGRRKFISGVAAMAASSAVKSTGIGLPQTAAANVTDLQRQFLKSLGEYSPMTGSVGMQRNLYQWAVAAAKSRNPAAVENLSRYLSPEQISSAIEWGREALRLGKYYAWQAMGPEEIFGPAEVEALSSATQGDNAANVEASAAPQLSLRDRIGLPTIATVKKDDGDAKSAALTNVESGSEEKRSAKERPVTMMSLKERLYQTGSVAASAAALAIKPLDAMNKVADLASKVPGKAAAAITSPLYDRIVNWGGNFMRRGEIRQKIAHGLTADYGLPEPYIDTRNDREININKVLRKSKELVDKIATLDRGQARIAYLWMQEKPNTREEQALMNSLPADAKVTLDQMKQQIDQLGKEAVKLGLLSQDSYDRNHMAYLHRTYQKYELENPNSVARGQQSKAIRAEAYKGRGLRDDVTATQVPNAKVGDKFVRLEKRSASGALQNVAYVPVGQPVPPKFSGWTKDGEWEYRFNDRLQKHGEIGMWRDLTAQERGRLGEIDEVRYAFARTMIATVRDIETARFLDWTAVNYAKSATDVRAIGGAIKEAVDSMITLSTYGDNDWVQVPSGDVQGTSIKKYGNLAGRYIPGHIWNDIRAVINMRANDEIWRLYDSMLKAWKISKTALSPAVHTNNVMSNFILADLADVGPDQIRKALKTILDAQGGNAAAKAIMERFYDSGSELGSQAQVELRGEIIEPLLKELENQQNGIVGQLSLMQAVSLVAHGNVRQGLQAIAAKRGAKIAAAPFKALIDIYRNEDAVFRLAKWMQEVKAGKSDRDAGKEARAAFLDYQINAPWIQMVRRGPLPFLAFSYRAIPLLINAAAHKPWKLMKYYAIGSALNAIAYGMLGGAGDEEKERKLLPEEKSGRALGIFPRMFRAPWNDEHGSPVFVDVRRWIPGGDIVDLNGSQSAVALPQWLSVGGPVSLFVEMASNKSLFTGKPIVLKTDTKAEAAAKVMDEIYKFMMPNLPIPNPVGYWMDSAVDQSGLFQTYSWKSIKSAGSGETDAFGRERNLRQAILGAGGVKIGSYAADAQELRMKFEKGARERELNEQKAQLNRMLQRGAITEEEHAARIDKLVGKKDKIVKEFGEKVD